MKFDRIFPCYYPTTIVLVDDSMDFLNNLSLQLDPQLAYQLYGSPLRALDGINTSSSNKPLYERCLSPYRDYSEIASFYSAQQVFVLDFGRIGNQVYNAQRFSEIAVAVVDYDMPEMNGLEFCQAINNPYIKKILLTGKADERVAVEAFNRGIIDRFIMKSDAQAAEKINAMVGHLQYQYFENIAHTIMRCLSVKSPSFLDDPAFAEFFSQIVTDREIIEYYFVVGINGLLGLTARGSAYLLLVCSPEDYRVHYEIVRDQNGPSELLECLEQRTMVPYFWRTGGFYGPETTNWREDMVVAKSFVGRAPYSYALVKNPPSVRAGEGRVLSYQDYLRLLDQSSNDSDVCSGQAS